MNVSFASLSDKLAMRLRPLRRSALALSLSPALMFGLATAPALSQSVTGRVTLEEPRSYKIPFPGRPELESWYARLIFPPEAAEWALAEMEIRYYREDTLLKTLQVPDPFSVYAVDTSDPARIVLPLHFNEPQSMSTDRVEIEYMFDDGGDISRETLSFAVETYSHRHEYIFPLEGNALLTNGYYNSGGHLSASTKFAIDIMGVDENLAMTHNSEGEGYDHVAGFGRPIIAPADGTVVFVQRGVPDQPYEGFDESLYLLPDGLEAIWGNAVVIDHGEGEFSALLHMQQGSVLVELGDQVRQGQRIGALGNSGASFGPHLHYHLQDGPELLNHSGLPLSFDDVEIPYFRRGEWVNRSEVRVDD